MSTITLSQILTNDGASISDSIDWAVGERFNSFPVCVIKEISFFLYKYGNPTGTLYVNVRKVSDDSIIGTLGTIDVTTIVGDWYRFYGSPVVINKMQDIRIMQEYTGGDPLNDVNTYRYNSGVFPGGVYTYIHYATFIDVAGQEARWNNLIYEVVDSTIPLGLRKVGYR
jgi:hypothetical protein